MSGINRPRFYSAMASDRRGDVTKATLEDVLWMQMGIVKAQSADDFWVGIK
jgi:hypothetical protein